MYVPDMPPCENVFDCEAKSLEQLKNLTDVMDDLRYQNNEMIELQRQLLKQANSDKHGFVYYIMSEIAVLYILWMLRNHLTARNVIRMCRGLTSLYQHVTARTTNLFILCRSRSTAPVEVELGPNTTMNNESNPDYQSMRTMNTEYSSIPESSRGLPMPGYSGYYVNSPPDRSVETTLPPRDQVCVEMEHNHYEEVTYPDVQAQPTAVTHEEREVVPSETASRNGRIFVV